MKDQKIEDGQIKVFPKSVPPKEALLYLQKELLSADEHVLCAGLNTVRKYLPPAKGAAGEVVIKKGGVKSANKGANFCRLHMLRIDKMSEIGVRYCRSLQQSEDCLLLGECRLARSESQPCILKSFLYDLIPDRKNAAGGAQDARDAADARKEKFRSDPGWILSQEEMQLVFCGGEIEELRGMDQGVKLRLRALAAAWPEENPNVS